MSRATPLERLVLVRRAPDGSSVYDLHVAGQECRFTISRDGRWTWRCAEIVWKMDERERGRYGPFRGDCDGAYSPVATAHESGWLKFGPRAFRRARAHVLRSARGVARERARKTYLHERQQPGYLERLERELLG